MHTGNVIADNNGTYTIYNIHFRPSTQHGYTRYQHNIYGIYNGQYYKVVIVNENNEIIRAGLYDRLEDIPEWDDAHK